ncbi:MAG: hypothetical protein H6627_06055 [Calditrichae bacterium]|nr:hypothetical protein [Calditrichota bacterium]MCB9058111.1 hypothetical protein [Calditrichia bacterium]
MNLIRHKISAFLLMVCLAAPAISTFGLMQYRMYSLKKEVKACIISGIDEELLVQIKLSHTEAALQLDWEHDEEFEYKGQMYDLVKSKVTPDSVYYWCWLDQKETELNNRLEEMTAEYFGRDPIRKDNQKKLLAYYSLLYILQTHDWENTQESPDIILNKFADKKANYFLVPPFPPPRTV